MKKDTNSVDDFFRESLQDYTITPSETARNRFLDEAAPAGGKAGGKFLRWYNILAIVVVITASVLLYFKFSHQNAPVPGEAKTKYIESKINKPFVKNTRAISGKENMQTTAEKPKPSLSSEIPNTNKIGKSTPKNSLIVKTDNPENVNKEIPIKYTNTTKTIKPGPTLQNVPMASENSGLEPVGDNSLEQQILTENNNLSEAISTKNETFSSEGDLTNIPVPSEKPEPVTIPPPNTKPFGFSPVLIYSLDWNPESNGNSLVHSLGVEGKLIYRRFSVISGASVTTTTGYHDYEVKYNDYLGNYQKLDSITFAYDQKRYTLEPTYYMSDTKVWDTVVKLDSYQEEVRYNQLRIPVMLGYDIISRGRFVLGVKTGVEMVFYLKSRNLTDYEYSAGQNKLVSMNSLSDELTRNNFWFMANLSVACNITRRIVFEIEPRMQYLLNPDKTSASPSSQEVLPALRSSLKIKF